MFFEFAGWRGRAGMSGLGRTSGGRTILVDSIAKSYAESEILKDVSFELYDGEFLTLLGPSGSGKSTTLGIVSGFVGLSRGDVRVGEQSIVGLPPRQRNLGIVFQNYALFPHMTVAENVEFGLRMRGVARKERRRLAAGMLERVGLAGFSERKPSQLSGGQRQRVALARALVINPTALLLDEPLGALDRRLRQQMGIELKEVQRKSDVSVLYVTHDQEEAMVMSDRVAVMHDGRIEQIDTPRNVYKYPSTRFVAEFLGEANIFDVTIEELRGDAASIRMADGACGKVLATNQTPRCRKGDPAAICIRPERLRVVFKSHPMDNQISGTIRNGVYLGSSIRYMVQALGKDVIVTVPDAGNENLLEPGTPVQLGWNAEDSHLLIDTNVRT